MLDGAVKLRQAGECMGATVLLLRDAVAAVQLRAPDGGRRGSESSARRCSLLSPIVL